jgi:hypothetical protein
MPENPTPLFNVILHKCGPFPHLGWPTHSGNISYKREVKNIFGGFFNFFGQNYVF